MNATATPPTDATERVREVVERIADAIGLTAGVTVEETDDEIRATVESDDDLGRLIGKQGATIDAVQHLASLAAFRGQERRKRVIVDAGNYRAQREATLQRSAERAAHDALSYKRPVELDPMSSAERRVVHGYLSGRTDVQTHSEGDEPERRIVVSPVKAADRKS